MSDDAGGHSWDALPARTGGRRIPCTRSRSSRSRSMHVPRPSSTSWRGTPGARRQTPCWASVKLSGRSCSFTDAVAPAVTKEWLAANNGGQRRCRRANTRKFLCRELLALWSLSVQSFETLRSDHAAPMQCGGGIGDKTCAHTSGVKIRPLKGRNRRIIY